MKKILILTYYFRPCNYVAANRPNSFSEFFAEEGWDVTVVTRNWSGKEKTWPDYLESNDQQLSIKTEKSGIKVHFLPYKSFCYPNNKFLSLLITASLNLQGKYNFELDFHQYEDYIKNLVESEGFDYILVSSPPLTIVELASKISKKYGCRLLVDVRDFENDILLHTHKTVTLFRKVQHKVLMIYLKRWLKDAFAIFTVSPPLTDYIKRSTKKEVFTLTNGFDDFIGKIKLKPHIDKFNISVIGTMYEGDNLKILLNGIGLLFQKNPEIRITFNLIGVRAIPEVAREFEAIIPTNSLNLTHRLDRAKALDIAARSHVLLLSGFESKGVYTTKVFEYLGLRKNIIQIPGDKDVVDELLRYTNGGVTLNTSEEFYNEILSWYEEWELKGTLPYYGIDSRIEEYSRRSQFQKLFQKLI